MLPSSQPTRIAGSCRQTVHQMALEMMSLTFRGYWLNEVPRSPCSMFLTKMKNCSRTGLFVPNSSS